MKKCFKCCCAIILVVIMCVSNTIIYADEFIGTEREDTTQTGSGVSDIEENAKDEVKVNEKNSEVDSDTYVDEYLQTDENHRNNYTDTEIVEQKSIDNNGEYDGKDDGTEIIDKLDIGYSAHIKNIGWQDSVKNGEIAGTTGLGLQMEAIKITLDNQTLYTGGIEYSAHIQGIGWQNSVADGKVAGTTGCNLRIEAIKIQLTGELEQYYNVYYRTHIANIGWMPWTINGKISGCVGLANRVEAIEIMVAKKDSLEVPSISSSTSYLQGLSDDMLTYSTHVQNIGNTSWVSGGNVTGTTGRNLRIEGINISLSQKPQNSLTGTIIYRTHVQGMGWLDWKTAGQYSGTGGIGRRVEAIEIKLTGQLAIFYNVYYSAHIQNYGWLDWASNGQSAGSTGIGYRMEALKIRLVRKDNGAPGATANYYKNKPVYTPKPAALDAMSQNAQKRASSTKWLIMTDTSACQVGVYSGSYGNWKRVALWSCGPGKPSTPTVKGEFTIYGRGKSFGSRTYTCWYYTQFYGNYLFHSVLYNHGSMTQIQDGTLGKQVSHGCVRLDINNAKWLYDNIPNGTKVVIY